MMQFIRSDLFLLTLTIGLFCGAQALYRRTRTTLLHPVLLTFLLMIAFLKISGIEYSRYREATALLDFMLGMSVVALGYLMYEQSEHIRGNAAAILTATLVGCAVGVGSVVGIAAAMGAGREILVSIAPKSVTVPIAVSIAEPMGGIVSITSVVVFLTGVFGSMAGGWVLDRAGVTLPQARGLAMGSAAHGVGTARAVEMGAVEGALSGLAIALMGAVSALVIPLAGRLLQIFG
ncbi:MAG: LrgB family protein [Alistipes sp.]|nr:LrgB family protein [Alistipes sp.]